MWRLHDYVRQKAAGEKIKRLPGLYRGRIFGQGQEKRQVLRKPWAAERARKGARRRRCFHQGKNRLPRGMQEGKGEQGVFAQRRLFGADRGKGGFLLQEERLGPAAQQGVGRLEAGAFSEVLEIQQQQENAVFAQRRAEADVLLQDHQPGQQAVRHQEQRRLRREVRPEHRQPLRFAGPDRRTVGETDEETLQGMRGDDARRRRRRDILRLLQLLFRDTERRRRGAEGLWRREEPQAGPHRRIRPSLPPGRVSDRKRHLQGQRKRGRLPDPAPDQRRRGGDGRKDNLRRRGAEHRRQQGKDPPLRQELHLHPAPERQEDRRRDQKADDRRGRHGRIRRARQEGQEEIVQIEMDNQRRRPPGEIDSQVRPGQPRLHAEGHREEGGARGENHREPVEAEPVEVQRRQGIHQEDCPGQERRGGERQVGADALEGKDRGGEIPGRVLRLRHRHPLQRRRRRGIQGRACQKRPEVRPAGRHRHHQNRRQEERHRRMLQNHEDRHGRQADIRQKGRAHKSASVHGLHGPHDNVRPEEEIPAEFDDELDIRVAEKI